MGAEAPEFPVELVGAGPFGDAGFLEEVEEGVVGPGFWGRIGTAEILGPVFAGEADGDTGVEGGIHESLLHEPATEVEVDEASGFTESGEDVVAVELDLTFGGMPDSELVRI